MPLADALRLSAAFANPEKFDTFRKHLDPRWIEHALEATGVATVRRRRLPCDQVVWVVLAMGLFRDRPIEDIVSKLDLALPDGGNTTVAKSSVAQARARVGADPMRWLFERSAATWASASSVAHLWRSLTVFGMDGSSLRVADSVDNRAHFGGQAGRQGTESGYPLVRVVALMVLRSHLLRAVAVAPYAGTAELREAEKLCEVIPDRSLTVLDRAYLCAPLLLGLERQGVERHWLTRAKKSTSYRVVERFTEGDELVEMAVSSAARKDDPSLPKTWTARAVRYQRPGFPARLLLTSLRDPKRFPADEIAALYHERWELELGYDELKTEMLGQEETIRSQTPRGVLQELWGIFIAYNMIRLEYGACRPRGRGAAHAHQLRRDPPARTRRMGVAVGHQPRRHPKTTRHHARQYQALPPAPTARALLPTRRQTQNEQLCAKKAGHHR